MKKLQAILAGVVFILGIFMANLVRAGVPDADALSAIEAGDTIPSSSLPMGALYYSAANPNGPPMPGSMGYDAWQIDSNTFLLDDLDSSSGFSGRGMGMMDDSSPPGFDDGGDGTNDYPSYSYTYVFPTNGLWLEITNVVGGLAYVNLHHPTNKVYEVWSKTDLMFTNWNIETEVFQTNTNVMPFTVPESNRTNLFLWARDWTSITSHGNTTPEWWFWKYFGTVNLSDTNLDSTGGDTFLFDYQHGRNPNIIQFSLQFTNVYFSTNVVNGSISIVCGAPSYEAVLINDTNTADAVWQAFSSTNATVNLPGNGTYGVEVCLKGLPPDTAPVWQTVSLTCLNLDAIPLTLSIINPAGSTVSVPMIQLQGLVSKALSSLTYDVSNASGVITNQPGYWQPAHYDTNLLAFTTSSFQCYDIGLTNGPNLITLHATDTVGNTTTTNFSYTLDYSGDHTAPVLSRIWPTNGTSIAGSNFTMQAQMDDVTATVTATINSNSVAGLVERSGAVWFNNLPVNSGTNTVTITATDAAGNMSTTNLSIIQSSVSLSINPLTGSQMNQSSVTVSGTIGDSSQKVIINGVLAVVSGNNWTATNVPVSPSGTVGLNAQVTDAGNNPLAAQTIYQPQPPTVVMASYEQTYRDVDTGYLSWDLDTGPMLTDDSKTYWAGGTGLNYGDYQNWAGEAGIPVYTGTFNNDLSGHTNDLPVAWEEGDSLVENAYVTETFHTKTTLALQPAGQEPMYAMRTYLVLVSALEYRVASIYDVEYLLNQMYGSNNFRASLNLATNTPLPPEQLQVNGQNVVATGIMNTNGSTWGLVAVSAPSGASVPLIPGATLSNPNNNPVFQMKAYQLVSQCVATTPANQSRTNLGVGEQVYLYFNPALPTTNVTWSVTAGSLAVASGITNLFTAPSNAANVTVTVTIGSAPVNFHYKVYAPTGYARAQIVATDNAYGTDNAGAGMQIEIWIGPTNVSFGAVSIMEVGEVATNATGYFANTNTWPASNLDHGQHGANEWAQLGQDNSVGPDTADSGTCIPPWSAGNFTWPIPVDWKVGNGPTNSMTGWSQNFTIDASGTVTIQKFGHNVTRTTNDVITTQ
jgi:hypothetical protein